MITENNDDIQTRLVAAAGKIVGDQGEQDYALRVTDKDRNRGYWGCGRTKLFLRVKIAHKDK